MRLSIQTLAGALAIVGALQASAQPAAPAAEPPPPAATAAPSPAQTALGPQTQEEWDLVDKDPDRAAAALAGSAFIVTCMMPLDGATSPKAYAAVASNVGLKMKTSSPKLAALAVKLEGVHGDTCRVTYKGAHVDLLWTTLGQFVAKAPDDSICTKPPGGPNRASLACKASASNPAYRLVIDRTTTGFTAAVTVLGPKA